MGTLIQTFRFASEAVTIEPMPEVLQLMDAHFNQIVERLKTDLQDVISYAARWNEQAWRIAVVLHAGQHGEHAGTQAMSGDTAASAIAIADWFAGEQLRILARGHHEARRTKHDEVLALLANNPGKGISAREVQRARIVETAEQAHALLAEMETDGKLSGKDSKPDGGGYTTRIFTKAQKFA